MNLHINGEPREVPNNCTITRLLEVLDVRMKGVAVERNRQVVPRAEHASTVLEEGDHVEVVTLVGGG